MLLHGNGKRKHIFSFSFHEGVQDNFRNTRQRNGLLGPGLNSAHMLGSWCRECFSASLCQRMMSFSSAQNSEKPPVSWVEPGRVWAPPLFCLSSAVVQNGFHSCPLSVNERGQIPSCPQTLTPNCTTILGKSKPFGILTTAPGGTYAHTHRAGWGMDCKCVRCPARCMFAFRG